MRRISFRKALRCLVSNRRTEENEHVVTELESRRFCLIFINSPSESPSAASPLDPYPSPDPEPSLLPLIDYEVD